MAVTLTLAQLAAHLRLGDGTTEPTGAAGIVMGRVLATASEMVVRFAPTAPDTVHDEATVRLAGYLYDSDPSGSSPGGPSAMRASGAASLLNPYRVRRAGKLAGEAQAGAVPVPTTGGLDAAQVRALISDWAEEGNADAIPTDKLPPGSSGVDQTARDAAAAAQATATANAAKLMPPSNAEADNGTATTIRGWTAALVARVVRGITATWARIGDTGLIPGGKIARKSYATTSAVNITVQPVAGYNVGDLVLDLHGTHEIRVYEVISLTASPYYALRGTVQGQAGAATGVQVWAATGNTDPIPLAKLSNLHVEAWARGEQDIPYSALDTVLESWAVKGLPPLEIIPNDRLPVDRLLPVPTAVDDAGKLVAVSSPSGVGFELIDAPTGGTGQATTWRVEYVQGDPELGQAGKVFIRLRYIERWTDAGVRASTIDVGNGYLGSDGHRHIAQGDALDIKALLASTPDALMRLVQQVPEADMAVQGLLYGFSDTAGQVQEVHFRKRIPTANQLVLRSQRLDSVSGYTANGYANSPTDGQISEVVAGRDGSITPGGNDAGIILLADIWILTGSQGGDYFTELVVEQASHINAAASVNLEYRAKNSTGPWSSLILSRDGTYNRIAHARRYHSVNRSTPRIFRWGYEYEFRIRQGGNLLDLAHSQEMAQLADHDYVDQEVHAVGQELGDLEGRVGTLESAPDAGINFVGSYSADTINNRTWTDVGIDVSAYSTLLVEADNSSQGGQDSVHFRKSWLPTTDSTSAPSGSVIRTMRRSSSIVLHFSVVNGALRVYPDGGDFDASFSPLVVWGW